MTTSVLDDLGRDSVDEARAAYDFVARILREAPVRRPTSADERRAHEVTLEAYRALGLEAELEHFAWNENLYATIALHFGVSTLATILAKRSPKLALALHALSAASYALDSSRKAFVLRRLLPFKRSQNVVATLPARGPRRLRVVFAAHADAAFTGLVFEPAFVRRFASKSGPLKKAMRVSTAAAGALAVVDALALAGLDGKALSALRLALAFPPFVAFALNADVTLRDHIVPGACDNLSGVAGGWLLAQRFLARRPEGVELVFATTGCEESGLGGAQALVEAHRDDWSTSDTVVVVIDGLSGGKLHTFREGEVFPIRTPKWIEGVVGRVRDDDPRFADVTPFEIPVGGTDLIPFACAGYEGISVGRVDPELSAPRNYHLPSDTLDAMDPAEIVESVDFVEALVWEIARTRP